MTAPPKVELFGIPVDNLDMEETVRLVARAVERGEPLHHVVVNAGKIVAMADNPSLREAVLSADVINADGMGVIWAARLAGRPLKERVAGIDLMHRLLAEAARRGWKAYFLGARPHILEKAVDKVRQTYGAHIIAGYRDGYFDDSRAEEVARTIADSGAQLLFVGISSPKKEEFLTRHKEVLSRVPFVMGVGGSFDVLAGKVRRAPRWMQRAGLEWLFRFLQEPRRLWKRYLIGNARFAAMALRQAWQSRAGRKKNSADN
ncbi:MAG: WecB/TagA/CpsF family glycosyltransferase [Chlorobi bacterium]|nr:WecB/TagA/CpsF family glycosyltransferase [Chlorobiota bacterium]